MELHLHRDVVPAAWQAAIVAHVALLSTECSASGMGPSITCSAMLS
jgi:hypothetical protein